MFVLFPRKSKPAWTNETVAWLTTLVALNATYVERARILAQANEASVLGDDGPIIELDRLTEIVNQTGDFAV